MAGTKKLTSGQKAAQTRKRRAAGRKAAATRKRNAKRPLLHERETRRLRSKLVPIEEDAASGERGRHKSELSTARARTGFILAIAKCCPA